MSEPEFFSPAELARHAGLSRRTVGRILTDPLDPLSFYKVGTRTLIRRSEFEAWMLRRQWRKNSVCELVEKAAKELLA